MPRNKSLPVIVSGSRTWTDYEFIRGRLQMLEHPSRVFVGDAAGADSHVRRACRSIGITFEVFHADWEAKGRAAGILRNEEMFTTGTECEHFIAFMVGNSRGTMDAIRRAYAHAIPWIEIHRRIL